jgi:tetratricopeptide (TPR) repeat protein
MYLDRAADEADVSRREETLSNAEAACRMCLEYSRANPECLNLTGLIFFMRGDRARAREFYKRAVVSRNDFPEALNNLGVLFLEDHPPELDEAIAMFQRSIRIDPGYTPGRWNLALAMSRKGDAAYAAADRQAEESGLNRAHPVALWNAFAAAERSYAATEDQLRRLLQVDPANFQALFLFSYLHLKRSNYAPTEDHRRQDLQRSADLALRCWELAPRDRVEARQCAGTLGAVYAAMAQVRESLQFWMACLALDPRDPECLAGFRDASAREAAQQQGLRETMQLAARNPGSAQGWLNLCAAAFEQGVPDVAVSACENALQLDGNQCLAHASLARHFARVLNRDRAVASCRALVACAGTQHVAQVQECRDLVSAQEQD